MEILKFNLKKINRENEKMLSRIIEALKKGKTIVFPTDTVYGILADPTNEGKVEKIFKIKGRSPKNYLPIFVRNIKEAKKIAKIDKGKERVLEKVWPGKVTVVLKRKKGEKLYGVAPDTIALRIPKFGPLNYILLKIDFPLTATSANISRKPASGNIKEVLAQFKNKKNQPDLVVSIGNLPKARPSTVIDLTQDPPKILRV